MPRRESVQDIAYLRIGVVPSDPDLRQMKRDIEASILDEEDDWHYRGIASDVGDGVSVPVEGLSPARIEALEFSAETGARIVRAQGGTPQISVTVKAGMLEVRWRAHRVLAASG